MKVAGTVELKALSMADFLSLEQVARSAPPRRHMAPPPRASRAENQPVFKQILFASAVWEKSRNEQKNIYARSIAKF